MNKKIFNIVLVMVGLLMTTGAQASFVIDDFSDDTALLMAPESEMTLSLSGSVFSGARLLEINKSSVGRGVVSAVVNGGYLEINAGSKRGALTTSRYHNESGFDFTGVEGDSSPYLNAFVLNLRSIDTDWVDITLTVDGVSASKSINTVGDVFFSHSFFGDLSEVKDIELLIHNHVAVDASFSSLESYGSALAPATVPLPSSVILLTSAISMLGFCRRKQNG